MLSVAGEWLFVHVPKTGGNSLQSILEEHSDDRLVPTPPRDGREDFEVEGPVTRGKHASLEEYRAQLPPELFASLFVFSIVRDPWERAVSQYFGPIRWHDAGSPPRFAPEDFAALVEEMPSIAALTSLDGRVALDFALRFERLAEDSAELLRRLGLPPTPLPHRNRGLAPRAWQSYYEHHPWLVRLVGERFADDVEAFGYRPPALRRSRVLAVAAGRRARTAAQLARADELDVLPRGLGPARPAVDVGQAMLAAAPALAEGGARLLRLRELVGRGRDLSAPQWLQLYATTVAFAPDLVLDLGRGFGNSTTVFVEAARRLGRTRVVSLGDDSRRAWKTAVAPRLRAELGDTWDAQLEALHANIHRVGFDPLLAGGERVLVFWDAHGRQVTRRVLRDLFPRLAGRENLVVVHDITDGRHLARTPGSSEFTAGPFRSTFRAIVPLAAFLEANDVETDTPGAGLRRARESQPGAWASLVAALPAGCTEDDLLGDSHWICFSLAAPMR